MVVILNNSSFQFSKVDAQFPSGNNEKVILAQICKLKLEDMKVKGNEEM